MTRGVDPKGGVRLVLHRGVKPNDPEGFDCEDTANLARWVASDRGVVAVSSLPEIAAARTELALLCRNWLVRTSGGS